MAPPARERRRVPRLTVQSDRAVSFGASFPARVMEINLSGVLLATKPELESGDRAELHARLGSRSLRVGIEIRNVSEETRSRNGVRRRLGAAFVGLAAEQRMLLLDLLGVGRS